MTVKKRTDFIFYIVKYYVLGMFKTGIYYIYINTKSGIFRKHIEIRFVEPFVFGYIFLRGDKVK